MTIPIQNALKLPAVSPDKMLSDAPPSRDDATTSCTCFELVDVNIFTSSGMIAPAKVPQVIIVASFHHTPFSKSLINANEARYVIAIEIKLVSQTSDVSGTSKSILSACSYFARANVSLIRYAAMLVTTISTRITKIQTSSL